MKTDEEKIIEAMTDLMNEQRSYISFLEDQIKSSPKLYLANRKYMDNFKHIRIYGAVLRVRAADEMYMENLKHINPVEYQKIQEALNLKEK